MRTQAEVNGAGTEIIPNRLPAAIVIEGGRKRDDC